MWKSVVHRLFGRASASYLMNRAWWKGPVPFPDDPPIVHGSGPDPDRVLLLGGAVARGIGVSSYELSIAGNLARKLAAATGHGADVEAHGVPGITVTQAAMELRARHLQRYDGIVLMLGGELITMRPLREWRHDLDRLMASLGQIAAGGPPVVVTAIPPFARAFEIPNYMSKRLARRIDRMNADLRRACADAQRGAASITFVDFDDAGPAPRVGSRAADAYESWAAIIAPTLAWAISRAAPELHRHHVPIDESERQQALDDLGLDAADADVIVGRIVEMARDMLGVPAASLTIIDHDRQWMMSASGIPAEDIPRSEAFCNTTIQTPGVFIVEDAIPEFQDASWVAGAQHIRSYAGYPVEAPGGHRVGALCVMDRSPRHFTPDDVATLRDLALRAQHELWSAAG